MKLLVSVADAVEAHAALLGGADIIDAKDPTRGALGPCLLPVRCGRYARQFLPRFRSVPRSVKFGFRRRCSL